MKDKIEKRFYESDLVKLRAVEDEGGKRFLEGYAAVFGIKSQLLFNYELDELFYEVIERTAFDEVLSDENIDVIFNYQHNDDFMIARSSNDSLELSVDETGLKIRAEIPNTSTGKDVYELVHRGLLKMSFAFLARDEDYRFGEYEDDIPIGYLTNVRRLLDVSAVAKPAYKDTNIDARSELATRSYESYLETKKTEKPKVFALEAESRKRKLN